MSPVSLLACLGAGGPNAVAAGSPLLTALVGYWKLDEASGSRADSSGNGETLTDNGGVTSAAGKQGNAAQLALASSQHLNHADDANLSMGAGVRMTLAGWFNLTGGSDQGLAGKWGASPQQEYLLFKSGSTWTFYVSSNGSAATNVGSLTPSAGTWHFIVGRYDGSVIGCRIDNQTWQTLAYTGDIFNGTAEFSIGREAGTNYFNGLADEVGLWKRALTDAEVDQLYNASLGRTHPFSDPFGPGWVAGLSFWVAPEVGTYDSTFTTPVTTNNTPLGGWRSRSPWPDDVSQATAGKQPTFFTGIQGGYAGMKFDGSDDVLFTGTAGGLTPAGTQFTLFVVLKTPATLGTQAICNIGGSGGGGASGRCLRIQNSGGALELLKANVASMGASSTVLAANTVYVVAIDYNSPSGTFYVNGAAAGSLSSAQTFSSPSTELYLGAQDNAGTSSFAGHILEVCYYDAQISGANLALVNSYLGAKYGLF